MFLLFCGLEVAKGASAPPKPELGAVGEQAASFQEEDSEGLNLGIAGHTYVVFCTKN